jgi:hypothetical protein
MSLDGHQHPLQKLMLRLKRLRAKQIHFRRKARRERFNRNKENV